MDWKDTLRANIDLGEMTVVWTRVKGQLEWREVH